MKSTAVFAAVLSALSLTVASSVAQAQAKPPIELRYSISNSWM